MFKVLPTVFSSETLGGAGGVIGFVFFLLVFFAALTSAMSIFEANISDIQDAFHVKRSTAIIICGLEALILGIVCNLGYNAWIGVDPMYSLFGIGEYQSSQILDFMDFLSNTILMPIVALLTCIFVGWLIKPKQSLITWNSQVHSKAKSFSWWWSNILLPFWWLSSWLHILWTRQE